jgi:hypothetical protein
MLYQRQPETFQPGNLEGGKPEGFQIAEYRPTEKPQRLGQRFEGARQIAASFLILGSTDQNIQHPGVQLVDLDTQAVASLAREQPARPVASDEAA